MKLLKIVRAIFQPGVMGWDDALIYAGIAAAGTAAATSSTNSANQAIAGQNQELGVIGSLVNMDFNSREAQRARDFSQQQQEHAWEFQQNMFNSSAREAQTQRDWQERMSNTQYQRTTADLQAAGLNPMLAYRNGGAGTPPGAMGQASGTQTGGTAQASAGPANIPPRPSITSPMAGVAGTAMDVMSRSTQIENMRATNANIEADTALKKSQVPKTEAETQQVMKLTEETTSKIQQLKFQHENTDWDTRQKMSMVDLNYTLKKMEEAKTNYLLGQTSLNQVQKAVASAQAVLLQYEAAGAKATSESNETWYGKNIRPYVNDAGKIISGAGGARRLLNAD